MRSTASSSWPWSRGWTFKRMAPRTRSRTPLISHLAFSTAAELPGPAIERSLLKKDSRRRIGVKEEAVLLVPLKVKAVARNLHRDGVPARDPPFDQEVGKG